MSKGRTPQTCGPRLTIHLEQHLMSAYQVSYEFLRRAHGDFLLLQHRLQARGAHVKSHGDLVNDGAQVGEKIAASISQDGRDCDLIHFGVEVVQFDEARGDARASKLS